MLGLAALILAAGSASADISLSPTSAAPWWEKVVYTIGDDGEQQGCRYESSLAAPRNCDDGSTSAPSARGAAAYTKITIERRFNPGTRPERFSLQSGDTLLGGQIMSVTIDGSGEVRSCKVVGASGDVRPDYGCEELSAERFQASAGRASAEMRQGFMTILVYGHEESIA